MKTLNKVALVLAASVAAVSANAAISYGTSADAAPYIGVKVGQVNTDLSNAPSSIAYGVYGGYNLDQNFGVEAEYLASENKDYTAQGINREYDAKTYGVYGTYRHHLNNTPFYAKGKLGLAKTDIDDKSVSGTSTTSKDETGLAGGVALGYNATSNIGVELGYNYLSSDANTWGVGAHLKF
ncbi:porin family protein [Moraxella nasovis]|uniref:porin family protein n=1 Tax=Moraxella nasovis TaxID=2904121 RepID=UPI001F60294D|nr:porin family protein [Moraxella nasovis]UNU73982.1 porin family protein [Moraxella nasovis]